MAQLYGTEPVRIRQNHHENKARFVEGKHFFKVVGNDLKELRVALNYSQNLRVTLSNSQNLQPSLRGLQISPKARSLILWTERGAARHAKMLETDQAWDVFEKLKTAISDKRIRQRQLHARKVTTREFSVISEAVSLFPQFSCGMMILLFPLSHGWNWREPMVGLLFAEINWWKG